MAKVPGVLTVEEPASPTKSADTNQVTRSTGLVQREVVSIGSPDASTPEQIADVTADGRLMVETELDQPLTDTQLRASDVPVSAASLPLPAGASTEATLAAIKALLDSTGVKFARINATASGISHVVAAVTSKKIRVLAYAFTVSAASTVQIQDDAGSPVILAGAFDLAATGGIVFVGSRDVPAFETTAGQALDFNLGATVNCRGHLCYLEV